MMRRIAVVGSGALPPVITEADAELFTVYWGDDALERLIDNGGSAHGKPESREKNGIVFFSGYWARSSDGPGQTTGDHIDLWSGNSLTSPGMEGRVTSFFRFRLGISSLWYSDLGRSKQILFWEIR
jgi:hypothetical protein